MNDVDHLKFWSGEFGDSYTDRNSKLNPEVEKIFTEYFATIQRESTILEVGCNIGLKLELLKNMGFDNLTGIEINKKALTIAKNKNPNIDFIESSIENFNPIHKFDLVFTSGVLVCIHPSKLENIVKKMINLSKTYIFGYEYFAEDLTEIKYRGYSDVLWKQNFPQLFKKLCPNIEIIEQKKYGNNKNQIDMAYLLKL